MKDLIQLEYDYKQALNYRASWDVEWKKITDFLLPGRGVYQLYNKPQIRKFVSPKVVNTVAREALQVLTSGFHGGLTSPSMPWFDIIVKDTRAMKLRPVAIWLEESKKVLYTGFEESNFYQTIHTFYTEFAGFGNSVMYCGEDSEKLFRFELLTVGEYAFSLNSIGRVDTFFRTIYKTNRNLVEKFGDAVSPDVKRNSKTNPEDYVTIYHAVFPEEYENKKFTSVYWEPGQLYELKREGFYEFPYLAARWDVIGSDTYGLGLGSYALPDIQRLQEMEKSFLMGAHKAIDPPLNAPARKKGKIKTLPGGINYYSHPNELVTPMLAGKFDFNGILTAISRTEDKIRRVFFNDIFLTASRDPNASPLKATEVMERKEERLLRIGPVIERVLHEFISPLIERCFNIAARKNALPLLPPDVAQYLSEYSVSFISPLAQAQKMIASRPINTFLQFVAGAAQFNPEALDKINIDNLVEEYADITGVPKIVMRDKAEVDQIRKMRAEQQRIEKEKQDAIIARQLQLSEQKQQSEVAQNYSEVGVNFGEATGGLGIV